MNRINYYAIALLSIMSFLLSCSKDDAMASPNLEEQLIGRWEIVETTVVNDDGIRETLAWGLNTELGHYYFFVMDYSSGFELMANSTLDLIWRNENKAQFFPWSLEGEELIIDGGTARFSITSVTSSTLELSFDNGNETYTLTRLE